MTTFSDETLMAFADDELEPAARALIAAAVRDDPQLQKRVAQHRALRTRVHLAYASQLDEAPPARLLAAARRAARRDRPVKWRPVTSMAASLVIGLGIGYVILRQHSPVLLNTGGLVANGALADALSTQRGGEPPAGAVARVGLSFAAKSGDYCRVFILEGTTGGAGVACHEDNEWRIQVLARQAAGGAVADGHFRTASSELPPAVLDTLQQQIDGEALDAAAEAQAEGARLATRRSLAHCRSFAHIRRSSR